MYFEPYGPFWPGRIEHREGRYWRSDFWAEVDDVEDGLSGANGVYIFAINFGQKFTPWYVGKTCANGGFAGEVFQDHKVEHYYETEAMGRGQPCLHLIALTEDNRGNFCRKSDRARRYIDRVETYLIELALTQNPKLRNDKKTKFRRELDIVGVIGDEPYTGRRTDSARTLRRVLGL